MTWSAESVPLRFSGRNGCHVTGVGLAENPNGADSPSIKTIPLTDIDLGILVVVVKGTVV
jgi:hypothetical protein